MKDTKTSIIKLSLVTVVLITGMLLTTTTAPAQDKNMMQKKALDAYVAAWNTGDADALDKYLTKDTARKLPQSVEANNSKNLAELKKAITDFRTLFPDTKVLIEEMIIQDTTAVARWTLTGTNSVKMGAYPGDGSKIKISGVSLFHFENGKIKKEMVYYDVHELRVQLGISQQPRSKTAKD